MIVKAAKYEYHAQEQDSKQFDLLLYLATNENTVVTHGNLARDVWFDRDILPSNITTFVSQLCQKIEPDPKNPIFIKTFMVWDIYLARMMTNNHAFYTL